MRRRGKLLITAQAGLACAALLGLALAVLRTHGLADARVSLGDGAAWLANASRGDAVLVSAASGEVLARASVGAPGDPITLVQHGPHALFLNAATGVVGRLDGAALTVTASTAFGGGAGSGAGAKVLTGGGGQLYLLDRDRGAAQALNPANLATLRTNEVPQGAAAAVVDAAGALWVADRASGTVTSLRRGGPPRRVAVAEPGDELGLAVVAGHAVAVNGSRAVVHALPGGAQGRACLPVGGETGLLVTGDDAAPAAGGGRRAYALTPAGGELFVADLADGSCSSLPLGPGRYGQPRAVDGAVYVPDLATGRVLVLDAASGQIEATQVLPADTEFRLFVEDGLVWFDNPAGPEAGVLQRDGSVVPVDKSQDGLPLLRAGPSGPANGEARAPAPKLAPEAVLRLLPSSALEAGIEASPTPAEVGEPITFTGSARGEPAPTSWTWTFDDGETAEGVIVRKAFAEPGLRQVTLTVANGQRNASTTAAITVVDGREQLTARFTTSTDSAAVGEPVVFEDRSLGEVTERSWSFGDGVAAPSARRVVHRFQAAGAYTVGLEVRGPRGAAGAERTITIRERPPPLTAAAEATPRRAPVGQAVTFTDRSEPAPAQSVWAFDDGARASGRVVRHAFATEGEHTATLRARSEAGEVSVATVTVLVVAPSAPQGEIAASSVQARLGAPITFSLVNLSGGPTSVVWSWGDGATTPAAPGAAVTKAWTAPGTYPVTASLTNSAGEFTASLSVRIVPPPGSEARFAAAPNPSAPGQAVRFSDRSTGAPTAWRWSFGDGAASTERNPVHAFAAVGVFDVSLEVVGADGKTSRTSEKVTVRTTPRPPPSARLAVTTPPDQRIAGRPITFTDTTPGAVGAARWRFEPGGEADGRTVTRTFPNPGTVEVTLRSCWADEPTICAAVVDRIEVLPAPPAPPNVVIRRLSPDPAPPGAPVSLADATAGAVGGHTWTVAGRTREGRVLTVSFPAAGDYPVKLRVCRTDQPTVCGETTIVVHVRERVGG